jgi:hypothetical protein
MIRNMSGFSPEVLLPGPTGSFSAACWEIIIPFPSDLYLLSVLISRLLLQARDQAAVEPRRDKMNASAAASLLVIS